MWQPFDVILYTSMTSPFKTDKRNEQLIDSLRNVYFKFSPQLHELICFVINQLSSKADPQRSILSRTDSKIEQPGSQKLILNGSGLQNAGKFKKPRLTIQSMLSQEVEDLKQQLSERDEMLRQDS